MEKVKPKKRINKKLRAYKKRHAPKKRHPFNSEFYSTIVYSMPWTRESEFIYKTMCRYQDIIKILRNEIIRLEIELKKERNEGIRKIAL